MSDFKGRKLHLIGIGGAGMSGLALAANQLGALVSGSDKEASSYTERLEEAGITVKIGHDAAGVPEGADVVRSTAIKDDNPELAFARERGLNVLHRSELLAELAATRSQCIAVAGTHGKTTTTAMIAHILEVLGRDPSFFVGGEVTIGSRTTNAYLGSGDVVVLEADESDGSFLNYSPDVAVITNVEFEHPETWHSLDQLLEAFRKFAAPADAIVAWAGQPRLEEIFVRGEFHTFGIGSDADLRATDVVTPGDPASGTGFLANARIPVKLGVRGEHNVLNALAAMQALATVDVDLEDSAAALASFTGVARRFEQLGENAAGVAIYDDYAHHPTEVRAALATARQTVGDGRVVAVFLPHLYSRTQAYVREFGEALSVADVIIVLDVYGARERAEDFPGVTGWLVATNAADAAPGRTVYYEPTFDDAEELLTKILRAGDLCIGLGAGNIHHLTRRLLGATA